MSQRDGGKPIKSKIGVPQKKDILTKNGKIFWVRRELPDDQTQLRKKYSKDADKLNGYSYGYIAKESKNTYIIKNALKASQSVGVHGKSDIMRSDLIREYICGKLYKRALYDRAPHIGLVVDDLPNAASEIPLEFELEIEKEIEKKSTNDPAFKKRFYDLDGEIKEEEFQKYLEENYTREIDKHFKEKELINLKKSADKNPKLKEKYFTPEGEVKEEVFKKYIKKRMARFANSGEEKFHIRSKFFQDFVTLQEVEIEKRKNVKGFGKVLAASFMFGEKDLSQANLGVVPGDNEGELTMVKIDHGRSGMFDMHLGDAMTYIGDFADFISFGDLKFDEQEFHESLNQMSQIQDNEIKNFVDKAVGDLKSIGVSEIVNEDSIDVDLDIYREEITEKIIKQKENAKLLCEQMDILSKCEPKADIVEYLRMGNPNALDYVIDKRLKIDGKDPVLWAIDQDPIIKIKGLLPLEYAKKNDYEIQMQDGSEDRKKKKEILEQHLKNRAVRSFDKFKKAEELAHQGVSKGVDYYDTEGDKSKYHLKRSLKKYSQPLPKELKILYLDFFTEFSYAKLYERLLYDRAPKIGLVMGSEELTPEKIKKGKSPITSKFKSIILRSKFLENYKSLSDFSGYEKKDEFENGMFKPDSPKLKKIKGFEKVMAACFCLGEIDAHADNIGVIEKDGEFLMAKIDHGRSGIFEHNYRSFEKDFPIDEVNEHKGLSGIIGLTLKHRGFQNIPFNLQKFKEAIDAMVPVLENEAEDIMKASLYQLKSAGVTYLNKESKSWEYWKDPNITLELKQRLKEMKEISEQANIFTKMAPEIEGYEYFADKIYKEDPILYALKNKKTIEGKDPITYAIDKDIKIGDKTASEYVKANYKEISKYSKKRLINLFSKRKEGFSAGVRKAVKDIMQDSLKTKNSPETKSSQNSKKSRLKRIIKGLR